MTINKYFGFDEDMEISAIHVYDAAKEVMDAAKERAEKEAARSDAIGIITEKIYRFFEYLGYKDTQHCSARGSVWEYVDTKMAAKQILTSLKKVGRVPDELIYDAAADIENNSGDTIAKTIAIELQNYIAKNVIGE